MLSFFPRLNRLDRPDFFQLESCRTAPRCDASFCGMESDTISVRTGLVWSGSHSEVDTASIVSREMSVVCARERNSVNVPWRRVALHASPESLLLAA